MIAASADRRPVDPPPVVELKIYEGDGPGQGTDVTFSYNANFFLLTELETARPMAHGRVAQAQTQLAVLTGSNVTGMAYLDRPTEAGYFIFPDMSIRHEGKYRLNFILFEQTKEAKDEDIEGEPGGEHFDSRLEIKTKRFTVYSAKKFPGLAESTSLSRTVAEQGCRVRIRRDVRMRRRETKPSGDYDNEEEGYGQSGRSLPNEPYSRERSHSLSSEDDRQPYHQRHGPGDYATSPYQYPPGAPQPGPGNVLGFLSRDAYQTPQFAAPQAAAQPSYQQHQPAPGIYQQGPHTQYRQPALPPSHSNYAYEKQYPQSAYPTYPPRDREFELEPRRQSAAGYPSHDPSPSRLYPSVDSEFSRYPHSYQAPPMSPVVNLPPIKTHIETKYEHLSSPSGPGPLSSIGWIPPPLPSPAPERREEHPSSYGQYHIPAHATTDAARNGKRSHDIVFSSAASNQPLYNGMRPRTPPSNDPFEDDDEDMDISQLKMQYKRADGSDQSRDLPPIE